MFLAIDIGNTHTVFGVFRGKKLLASWRVTSNHQRTEDEVGSQLLLFLKDGKISRSKINGIGISSVVPNLTDIFAAMAKKYFTVEPVIISSELKLGITIHYDEPSSVGADRLCNAVAGYAKYGGPLIIVDFGTATTFDVVASNGDYLGGVIAPGVETSAADLHRRAAKLPKVELHFPKKIIGTDTVGSMQAGILYGALDALEGMIHRLQNEIERREGKRAKVVATGGFSELMSKHSKLIEAWEPSLVLDGVRIIYERVR
ncbi:MAG TPA: type III pantothenate kinase [Bacteroidota bacterium]|nr:type III pantothenate kinase [Bacteroidota bacterium]